RREEGRLGRRRHPVRLPLLRVSAAPQVAPAASSACRGAQRNTQRKWRLPARRRALLTIGAASHMPLKMDNSLRRRLFLQLLALSSAKVLGGCDGNETGSGGSGGTGGKGGSAGTGGVGGTGGTGGSAGSNKDVVVVGGGLAGLCAAYELKKKGFNIVAI